MTQQKVARSWSTQIDIMESYPEHRFCATSAQQYKWLEELYPRVFERLQQRVKSGQFGASKPSSQMLISEVIGGTWVCSAQ